MNHQFSGFSVLSRNKWDKTSLDGPRHGTRAMPADLTEPVKLKSLTRSVHFLISSYSLTHNKKLPCWNQALSRACDPPKERWPVKTIMWPKLTQPIKVVMWRWKTQCVLEPFIYTVMLQSDSPHVDSWLFMYLRVV